MEFKNELEKEYNSLMNEESDKFEISKKVNSDPDLVVKLVGIKDYKEHYDEGKYSIDSIVEISIDNESRWDEVDDIVESVEDTVRDVNMSSIGLSSPVVVRVENDQKVKKWARRILLSE